MDGAPRRKIDSIVATVNSDLNVPQLTLIGIQILGHDWKVAVKLLNFGFALIF